MNCYHWEHKNENVRLRRGKRGNIPLPDPPLGSASAALSKGFSLTFVLCPPPPKTSSYSPNHNVAHTVNGTIWPNNNNYWSKELAIETGKAFITNSCTCTGSPSQSLRGAHATPTSSEWVQSSTPSPLWGQLRRAVLFLPQRRSSNQIGTVSDTWEMLSVQKQQSHWGNKELQFTKSQLWHDTLSHWT